MSHKSNNSGEPYFCQVNNLDNFWDVLRNQAVAPIFDFGVVAISRRGGRAFSSPFVFVSLSAAPDFRSSL